MKRGFRRFLAMMMVVVMILCAAPLSGFVGLDFDLFDLGAKASALDATGVCGDNITYTFDQTTGLLTISGSGQMYDYDSSYGSNNRSPFQSNMQIITVVVENNVMSIGNNAFYGCDSMTSITIPDSVTSIGDFAFCSCNGLTSVTIPNGVTSIGENAFEYCGGLTSVKLGSGVTNIVNNAFYYCTNLASITIYDSVISIGDSAFYNCTGLRNVYYTGSETDWNAISFGSSNNYLLSATKHYNYDPNLRTGICGYNVTYTLNLTTGLLTISGSGGMTYSSPFDNDTSHQSSCDRKRRYEHRRD